MRRLLVVLLLVVPLTGCGGGNERLSASEYRQQAGDICRKANAKLKAFDNPKSVEDFRQLAKKAKRIVGDALDDYRDLKPPESLQDAHDRWLKLEDRILTGLDKAQNLKSEAEVVAFAREYGSVDKEADVIATKQLGVKACAED